MHFTKNLDLTAGARVTRYHKSCFTHFANMLSKFKVHIVYIMRVMKNCIFTNSNNNMLKHYGGNEELNKQITIQFKIDLS